MIPPSLFSFIDLETLKHIGTEALTSKIALWTYVFTICFHLAWFKVRKEMRDQNQQKADEAREQNAKLVAALTGQSTSILEHGKRIDNHEKRIGALETDVEELKTHTKE